MTQQTVANLTTTRKLEVSWDNVLDGNFPESPARTAWREAVAEVADNAKATLPACNGRIEKAVSIVLAGDVVVGAEGAGLSRLVRERVDVVASIPLAPGVESLNASVAASLAVFEVMRSRAG